MKYFLTIGMICLIIGCTPLINSVNGSFQPVYSNKYDEVLAEDEEKIFSDYTSMISKRSDGRYISRKFYPDNNMLIEYSEFTDPSLITQIGPSKIWSDFGVLMNDCSYSDGLKTGLEQNFHHETGDLVSVGNYMNDERFGLWKYYKNGKLHQEINYEKGKKDGPYKIYNPEGLQVTKGNYEMDSLIQTNILQDGDWVESTDPKTKESKMPIFGDGCPEFSDYLEKKKCAEQKMLMHIYSSLRYPAVARENGVEGTSIVKFVVDKEGNVKDISVVRGLCKEIREEVQKVVESMPQWIPGEQDGKKADVIYTLPVRFKLE